MSVPIRDYRAHMEARNGVRGHMADHMDCLMDGHPDTHKYMFSLVYKA